MIRRGRKSPSMKPGSRVRAARFQWLLDPMTLLGRHRGANHLPWSEPIECEQLAQMTPTVLAFCRAKPTANDAFALAPFLA